MQPTSDQAHDPPHHLIRYEFTLRLAHPTVSLESLELYPNVLVFWVRCMRAQYKPRE